MANRGSFCCPGRLSFHSVFTLDQPSYLINNFIPVYTVCGINVTIGVSLLLFPVIGLLADVCFTTYRMMQVSFVSSAAMLILFLIIDFIAEVILSLTLKIHITKYASIPYVTVIVTIICSIGSFEDNAIQFGMDHL